MTQTMTGKVALVTGGGSGLGRASAIIFAREGARVVVSDIDETGGTETVSLIREAGGDATFVPCDVTSVEQVDALIAKTIDLYGRLDCAHNNAGGGGGLGRPMTHQVAVEDWLHVIEINLNSIWYCMRREIPIMLEQGAGAIVNTSSIYGIAGAVGTAAYVAGKHGVVGLTKAAALEYADKGVRVNAVCPAHVPTTSVQKLMDDDPGLESWVAGLSPSGRMGRPEEIGETVVWLCSDAASFVTGHAMPVDGGWTAQ